MLFRQHRRLLSTDAPCMCVHTEQQYSEPLFLDCCALVRRYCLSTYPPTPCSYAQSTYYLFSHVLGLIVRQRRHSHFRDDGPERAEQVGSRRCVADLKDQFGFKLGGGNQCYQ
eukprot:4142405-Pyramimonas_sp.AAC.1